MKDNIKYTTIIYDYKISKNLQNFIYYSLFILSIYFVLEDFILKFLPIPNNLYFLAKQFPDIFLFILYSFYLFIILTINKVKIPSHLSLYIFIIFVFYLLFTSLWITGLDFFAFANIKALIRYIFLLFIIYSLNLDNKKIINFIKLIILLSFLEAIIGFLEIFGGNTVLNFFMPRIIENNEMGITFTSVKAVLQGTGEIFGTLPYTINYSLFLLIGLCLWLFTARNIYKNLNFFTYIFGVLFLLIPLYFSGSRIGVLSAIFVILLYLKYKYGLKLFFISFVFLTLTLIFLYPFIPKEYTNSDFWAIFNPEYLENLKAQRLGIIEAFLSHLVNQDFIFGIGSDKSLVENYLWNNWNVPIYFGRIIEDVYWVALTIYYGYFGVLIFIIFLLSLYFLISKKSTIKKDNLTSNFIFSIKVLFLLLIPLNFVNQAFEVRTFSFYFWVLLGITLSYIKNIEVGIENTPNK